MKILFVSDTYYPHINGVYYFVCRIGPMLQKRGHEVAVIAPSESTRLSLKQIDGLAVHGLPSLSTILYPNIRVPIPFLLRRRIKDIIEDFNPDVIHLQDHFVLSKTVLNVNRMLQIPIVATNHFMPENISILVKNPKWKEHLEKYLWKDFSKVYNKVNHVTTPTETGAELIRPHLDVEVSAISSGIDLERFTPYGDTAKIKQQYTLPDKPVLLYVGRLDPEKRIDEVLTAVAIAVKKIDFLFVIVGKGTIQDQLEELTMQLGITDHVLFTGFVLDEDLPYFYKLSKCFIIASIAELLSLAALQAMASGLPVIAAKAGALIELVRDGINGYLFAAGDIPAMAEGITMVLSQEELNKSMRQKSLEHVQQHDIYKTLESFEKLYAANAVNQIEYKINRANNTIEQSVNAW